MNIKLIAFGIAKDILSNSQMDLELKEESRIEDLKSSLIRDYPEFNKLKSLKFAINEDYQDDSYQIKENDEVVIIPPVSGG